MRINKENYEAYFLDYVENTLSDSERLEVEVFLSQNPELALELDEDLPVLSAQSQKSEFRFSGLKQKLNWDENEVTELLISELEESLEDGASPQHDKERLSQFETSFPNEVSRLRKVIAHTYLLPSALKLEERDLINMLKFSSNDPQYGFIGYIEGDLNAEDFKEVEKSKNFKKEISLYSKTKLIPVKVTLPFSFKEKLKRKAVVIMPLWLKQVAAVAAIFLAVFYINYQLDSTESIAEFVPRVKTTLPTEIDNTAGTEENYFSSELAKLTTDKNTQLENPDGLGIEKLKIELNTSHSPTKECTQVLPYTPVEYASELTIKNQLDDKKLRGVKQSVDNSQLAIYNLEPENNKTLSEFALVKKETPLEVLQRELKNKVGTQESLAVTMVNTAARKLKGQEEEFMAYEKSSVESDSGFKLRIGKLSIESSR